MPSNMIPPPKEELAKAYKDYGSLESCAKEYSTSKTTMAKWLRGYDIPRRVSGKSALIAIPSKDEFFPLYRCLSSKELAAHYSVSVSTVQKWRKALVGE